MSKDKVLAVNRTPQKGYKAVDKCNYFEQSGELRNHFSIVILNTFKYTWFILLGILVNFLPRVAEDVAEEDILSGGVFVAVGLLVLVAIIFIIQLIRWRKTYIIVQDGQLIVDKRFKIMKNKTTVRLSSIASVNLKQNILQQILNVYSVQLDINSAVTANKTDFILVFHQEAALGFKKMITERKEESEPQTADRQYKKTGYATEGEISDANAAEQAPILSFPVFKVIRHCLLSLSITSILFSLLLFAGVFFSILFPEEGGKVSQLNMMISALIVLVPVLVQCVSPFFRYYGFTVSKQNARMVVSYGLLTKQQYTLPLDKTSALIIRQTMFSRLAGLYYGEIINVGMGDEESHESPVFCLMVTKPELDAVIDQIAPAYQIPEPAQHSPVTALFPIMIKITLLCLPAFALLVFYGYWWVGCIGFALLLMASYLSYRTKGLSIQEKKTAISSGVFAKKTIIISYSKIQNLSITDGPVSRRFGLCKGNATILAALANKINAIGYFPAKEFEALSQAIVEHESIEKDGAA